MVSLRTGVVLFVSIAAFISGGYSLYRVGQPGYLPEGDWMGVWLMTPVLIAVFVILLLTGRHGDTEGAKK